MIRSHALNACSVFASSCFGQGCKKQPEIGKIPLYMCVRSGFVIKCNLVIARLLMIVFLGVWNRVLCGLVS